MFKLTDHQKECLAELLSSDISPPRYNTVEDLFDSIEHVLRESFLPPKGERSVPIKDYSDTLKLVSKKAKALNLELEKLKPTALQHIDTGICLQLKVPFPQEIKNGNYSESTPKTSQLSSIVIEIIQEEADMLSDYYSGFSGGYMKWIIPILAKLYPAQDEITVSDHSKFIRFICIILEEKETETIKRQVLRSDWYKNRKELQLGDKSA